ncbi:signal peptidase I [Arthrobacter ginsengisoli]|uniref:Signal peptidase I n=1 Tax=Arthrobacter ginsengisoli TaxID=1356565 RepID=A0ABU1UDE2_9MICC|nr:signal peptidase I [Arthrobacter ginsengisoli]MDR7083196.1 signal peptidase I [Arthrobacter ginsengisoli]
MNIGAGRKLPLWASVALNMLIALVAVSLVQGFLVKAYRIPSGSMEPTLQGSADGGDRILVNRLAYLGSGPGTGDIVVFTRPESWQAESAVPRSGGIASLARSFGDVTGIGPSNERFLVKRVVASGGQTISCCGDDGKVRIDGQPLDEPYLFEDLPFVAGSLDCQSSARSLRCVPDFTVPEGELVVLGDHRSNSVDSAINCRSYTDEVVDCVRTIESSAVVGQVAGRFWPLNRVGGVG